MKELNNIQSGNIGSCVVFELLIIYSTKLQKSSLSKIASTKENKSYKKQNHSSCLRISFSSSVAVIAGG
jgi:hypothetical protein